MTAIRSCWVIGLLGIVGLLDTVGVRAAALAPEYVLKERGLVKEGVYFVLAASELKVSNVIEKMNPDMMNMMDAGDKWWNAELIEYQYQDASDRQIGWRGELDAVNAVLADMSARTPQDWYARQQIEDYKTQVMNTLMAIDREVQLYQKRRVPL